ncbi:O-antigen ligase family protein [candidate division CSSED10-310 bacterium]|uniref:O-antigen ligase family protein n=1 Tax=candidate division CSSED10-310 bacterium TaxID=2855610 RepID=A0ABV6YR96_UNCC1
MMSKNGAWHMILVIVAAVMLSFSFRISPPLILKEVVFVIGAGLLGLWLILDKQGIENLYIKRLYILPFFLYWIFSILSVYYSQYAKLSIEPSFKFITLAVFLICVLRLRITPEILRYFFYLILVLSFVSGLYGLLQYLNYDPVPWQKFETRVFSTFGHPNIYASYLIFAIPVIIAGLLDQRSRYIRLSGVVVVLLSLTNLILTGSRGAWLALLVVAIPFFFSKKVTQRLITQRSMAFVLLVILSLIILMFIFHDVTSQRFFSLFESDDPGIKSRLIIYKSSLRAVKEHSLLGWGLGTFSAVFPLFHDPDLYKIPPFMHMTMLHHAHSEFIEIALEQGLLGILLFASCISMVMIRIYQLYEGGRSSRTYIPLGIFVGVMALLAHSMVSVSFRFLTTQLLFWSGCMIILNFSARQETNASSELITNAQRVLLRLLFIGLVILLWAAVMPDQLKRYWSCKNLHDAENALRVKDYEKAEKLLQNAHKHDPYSIDTLNALADLYFQNKDLGLAASTFHKIETINPHYPLTRYHLALISFLQGNYEQARVDLLKAEKYRPRAWQIEELRGEIFVREGNMSEAEKFFQLAIFINPSALNSIIYLGLIEARTKNYGAGMDYISRALFFDPNNIAIWEKVAQINSLIAQERHVQLKMEKLSPRKRGVPKHISAFCVDQPLFSAISPSLSVMSGIRQSFTADCAQFRRFQFRVATNHKSFPYTFHFELYEKEGKHEKLLRSETLSVANLEDNSWLEVSFEPVKAARRKGYTAKLKADQASLNKDVYLWINLLDNYPDGEVQLDSMAIKSDLAFHVK